MYVFGGKFIVVLGVRGIGGHPFHYNQIVIVNIASLAANHIQLKVFVFSLLQSKSRGRI